MRKVVLTITPLEWLVLTHIYVDRNTEEEKHKIKRLLESILRYYNYFKSFTGLQLQIQLNHATCLVALPPDVVPNVQNRALKKPKLDSNPRYGPGFI